MPVKKVQVSAELKQKYEISLHTRDLHLTIDQPKPAGDNLGPTPLEYFLFALAGCIVTIGRNVAAEKKIHLNGLSVDIEGELNTDYLAGKTKEGRAGYTNIQVNVHVDADLSQVEKEAFIKEVDERCPISDNIEHLSHISICVD